MIIVSIFTVSCSEESLDLDPNQESSTVLAKSGTAERDKLLELAQGLAPAIKQYNIYYKQENKFFEKYGSFDKENVFGVKLPQYSEDVMLIIPFASKNLKKNKILIAYYKNGERQYKIFTKKKHKEKKREKIEEGILTHLDFIFEMLENETEGNQSKTVLNKYCDYLWSSSDPSNCTDTYTNCQGQQIIIYNSDKMGGCGSDYGMEINADEMEIHMPLDPPPVQYPSYSPPEDNDPDTTIDDECDYWDYDCNGGTGGGTPDVQQGTISFNTSTLNPTQINLLSQALSNLKNGCVGDNLVSSLSGSVNVAVDGVRSNGFPAVYNATYNTIYFLSNESIGSDNLSSELFHVYQQQSYGILDDIMRDPLHVGGSNIELEEKAFNYYRDSMDGAILTWPGTETMVRWMQDLEINHPDSSNVILSQNEIDEWFGALEIFKEYHTPCPKDMYCKPINYNLKPTAITTLINKLRSNNCY